MTTLTEDYWLVDIIHNNQQIGDVSERVRTLFTVHITTDRSATEHAQSTSGGIRVVSYRRVCGDVGSSAMCLCLQ